MPALLQAEASEDDLGEAIIGLAVSGAVLLAIAVTGRYSVLQLAIPDDWQDQPAWARRSRAMTGIAAAERVTVDPDQLAARRAAIDEHYRGITRSHGQALTDGEIDLPEYQRRMVGSITEAHTVQRRLGQGPLGMTGRQSLQDTLEEQLGYFDEFLGGIDGGELSAAQIVDRSGRYGANGGLSFNQGMDEATRAIAATEQRSLGNCTPHCQECVEYAARGVVTVGTLPMPRERCSCRDRCCCILTRFDLGGAVVGWIG